MAELKTEPRGLKKALTETRMDGETTNIVQPGAPVGLDARIYACERRQDRLVHVIRLLAGHINRSNTLGEMTTRAINELETRA